MGAVFEREVIKGFIHLSHIELHPFYMIKSPMVPGILKVSRIERIIYFDGEKDVPRLPTLECRLLKPKSQIFKAWDFIIEDAHTKQIVFVQVTTQFPNVHDKSKDGNSKMASAFVSFDSGSNQIETLLDTLFQTTGTKAHVDDGSFVITLPVTGWIVKFLCVTSQHDDDLKKRLWKWKDVLVAGRETISTLKLCFTQEQTEENKQRN